MDFSGPRDFRSFLTLCPHCALLFLSHGVSFCFSASFAGEVKSVCQCCSKHGFFDSFKMLFMTFAWYAHLRNLLDRKWYIARNYKLVHSLL